ncbi:hypothetical protein MGWOODY_XGa2135 [hydrothermal vent metagenome]|jgi:hypothetical protein|uniref:Uncharacterized protein n=1 Tax=hydrothermal vent metagenome TaxID=652676 RepID=A0A160TX37_9ZZZZ|tara:strand:- start:2332 stop:2766 length:435 start_codon:yes stop_codon:yes gene_type:complete
MSKSPPRYLDQTVAKWAVANDDHVLKGPEAALLTVLDSKEFSILDYDIVMRRARKAQAQEIRLLIGQLGHAIGRVLNAIWATLSDQKRGIRASRYQDGLIRSLPDHLLRDIGIEPPIRLQTRTNQFQSPLEFQTWLAYNQTFWR